jgi:hypothetical protein
MTGGAKAAAAAADALSLGTKTMALLRPLLMSRYDGKDEEAAAALGRCSFTEQQRAFVESWMSGAIDLINRRARPREASGGRRQKASS